MATVRSAEAPAPRYHKNNGKKVQNPEDRKYAASWEERYHKKRHFHHFSRTTTTRRPRELTAETYMASCASEPRSKQPNKFKGSADKYQIYTTEYI